MLRSVDLPEPEAPMMETSSPRPTCRLMSLSTCRGTTPGYVLFMFLRVIIAMRNVNPVGGHKVGIQIHELIM